MLKRLVVPFAALGFIVSGCASENVESTENVGKAEEISQAEEVETDNSTLTALIDEVEETDGTEPKVVESEVIETPEVDLEEETSPLYNEEELAYAEVILKVRNIIVDHLNVSLPLMQEAHNNPSLYDDEEWQSQFESCMEITVELSTILSEATESDVVPEVFVGLHELMVNVTRDIFEAEFTFYTGTLLGDEEAVEEGIKAMLEATEGNFYEMIEETGVINENISE